MGIFLLESKIVLGFYGCASLKAANVILFIDLDFYVSTLIYLLNFFAIF